MDVKQRAKVLFEEAEGSRQKLAKLWEKLGKVTTKERISHKMHGTDYYYVRLVGVATARYVVHMGKRGDRRYCDLRFD